MVAVTRSQKRVALGIALVADAVQVALPFLFGEGVLSPFADVLDVIVAVALLLTLGFKWRTLLALGVELVPGVALFPSWTAMAATLPAVDPEPVAKALPDKVSMG
jgi:hypothetical protein